MKGKLLLAAVLSVGFTQCLFAKIELQLLSGEFEDNITATVGFANGKKVSMRDEDEEELSKSNPIEYIVFQFDKPNAKKWIITNISYPSDLTFLEIHVHNNGKYVIDEKKQIFSEGHFTMEKNQIKGQAEQLHPEDV